MQDLHLLSNERWTRATMLGLSDIPSEATAILAIPLQNSTEVSDIRLFICPHKKNQGVYVKSGGLGKELDSHARPIYWEK